MPGALSRAIAAFNEHPEWLLLYGQGEHVDVAGQPLGLYPTLPPTTPIEAFTEGCFICQPTVFFRRTLPVLLGKFDQELKCAFDFDYWLRAFKSVPERIGFIDVLQAQSRLHEQCITIRQRRGVMLEGMQVLHRHLGRVSANWVRTYRDELISGKASVDGGKSMCDMALELLDSAQEYLTLQDQQTLRDEIFLDPRLSASAPAALQVAQTPRWQKHSNCLASAWSGKRFSMAISLGSWRQPAQVLSNLEYRAFPGPFDWIISSPEMLAHVLQDDFRLFLGRDEYEPVPISTRAQPEANLCDHRYYREKFGLRYVFNHHSPDQANDYAHYQRSVQKFRTALKEEAPPLLVLVTRDKLVMSRFAPLQAAIERHCDNYGLLLVRFVVDNAPTDDEYIKLIHHDDTVLALELRVTGPSNDMIFVEESDNVRFLELLESFDVAKHPRHASSTSV
jgi:hypothetical protein